MELNRAVEAVVTTCLAVRPGEDVVVVVDAGTREIGEALREAAGAQGAEATLAVMDARANHGEEPPAPVAVHVAFGASAGIGGTVSVPIHIDCVVLEPTLTIGGMPVIDAGRLVL